MKRILLLITATLLLSIGGQSVQAKQKAVATTVSATSTADGYWTGYRTRHYSTRTTYWTWVSTTTSWTAS